MINLLALIFPALGGQDNFEILTLRAEQKIGRAKRGRAN